MVYNYDSLWVHLHVAFNLMIENRVILNGGIKQLALQVLQRLGRYPNFSKLSLEEAFRMSTDGTHCPISHWFKKQDFMALCQQAGLNARFKGAAISLLEMSRLPFRFQALQDHRLPEEHREFLHSLTFDSRGLPLTKDGHVAGIDGCYEVTLA
jgi:hypothetical protein